MGRLYENVESVKWQKLPRALPLEPTTGAYSTPYEPPVAMVNVMTHLGLFPMTIKLNPLSILRNGGQQK